MVLAIDIVPFTGLTWLGFVALLLSCSTVVTSLRSANLFAPGFMAVCDILGRGRPVRLLGMLGNYPRWWRELSGVWIRKRWRELFIVWIQRRCESIGICTGKSWKTSEDLNTADQEEEVLVGLYPPEPVGGSISVCDIALPRINPICCTFTGLPHAQADKANAEVSSGLGYSTLIGTRGIYHLQVEHALKSVC